MNIKFLKAAVVGTALVTAFILPMAANATLISATLPEVNGGNGAIGDFLFAVPLGEEVTSATISGTWGNSQNSTSGPLTLLLDGILVAECVSSSACTSSPGPDAWSYTFSMAELTTGFLNDGIGSLTQNATAGVTRIGSLLLSGETSTTGQVQVSAPATLALFGLGLAGICFSRRKKA
ncbi:MAG: hypothetical protein ACI8Z9_001762 [Paraglaciecola sp.]|jgi:hypothetical protein